MGQWLAEPGHIRHGQRAVLARWLAVSGRTLQNWRVAALAPPLRGPGRPPRSALGWRAVVRDVQAALAACGRVGWRTVHGWLGGRWSSDAVQRALAWCKARWRRGLRRVREAQAMHVSVREPGSVWSLDGTHVGRDEQGRALQTQSLKDNGSRMLLVADLGPAPCGRDAVRVLDLARAEHGGLPLALLTDNGPPYNGRELASYLERQRVVHIRNLPHTPQHNGACEQIHRELKAEAELGKGVRIGHPPAAAAALGGAMARLNARPRAVLGGRCASEQHATATRRYTRHAREELYAAARRAMHAAQHGTGTTRARRLAARRAALATLEHYGIITQTRGSDHCRSVKPEEVS